MQHLKQNNGLSPLQSHIAGRPGYHYGHSIRVPDQPARLTRLPHAAGKAPKMNFPNLDTALAKYLAERLKANYMGGGF